jgi:hypothetical protein
VRAPGTVESALPQVGVLAPGMRGQPPADGSLRMLRVGAGRWGATHGRHDGNRTGKPVHDEAPMSAPQIWVGHGRVTHPRALYRTRVNDINQPWTKAARLARARAPLTQEYLP